MTNVNESVENYYKEKKFLNATLNKLLKNAPHRDGKGGTRPNVTSLKDVLEETKQINEANKNELRKITKLKETPPQTIHNHTHITQLTSQPGGVRKPLPWFIIPLFVLLVVMFILVGVLLGNAIKNTDSSQLQPIVYNVTNTTVVNKYITEDHKQVINPDQLYIFVKDKESIGGK